MHLGYLVHNLNDPAVERRCSMLARGGASIALAGFCRDAALAPAIAQHKPMVIGQSADAAMVRRALSTLREAVFHRALARHFADCDVICARNLEQLAIARTVAGERPLIYECLDIHRSLVGSSLPARLVQRIEAALLPRVDLLMTSSPAFVRHHFASTTLDAPIELVENKLLVEEGEMPGSVAPKPSFPIRMGWFGMLRCSRTLEFLSQLVSASDGTIEVLIAGKPSSAELPHLQQVVEATPGMTFSGPYRYSDLPELYGQCHFAWAIDWFEEGLNSSWLLPNRLYEPLAYGVVPIALRNVEVGRWLAANDAGLLVETAEDARERLLALTLDELSALQSSVQRIDRGKLVAGDADCRALVGILAKARRR